MLKVKPVGKIIILLLVIGIAVGAFRVLTGGGGGGLLSSLVPSAKTQESVVPLKADLPQINDAPTPASIKNVSMPGSAKAAGSSPEVRMLVWAWNAQMGLMFANGGPETTQGSLMATDGVNLKMSRQDDGSKMQEALVEFATSLSRGNAQPDRGAHYVAIMGDGSATFLAALNKNLERLGPEYRAKVVGSSGFSRGEDKFMGPTEWKANPSAAKGGVVAGYLRDGDWNIAQKWLGDNGLKNNPDEKTYDPDALNWVAANDYIDAGEKYITGYTETRKVVRNGKATGETKQIHVDGVVTWTPGDVNVAEKKGGLDSIVSTKEYSAQMPQVIIGIDKWMKANPDSVQHMLEAMVVGGDAVRSSSEALRRGAEVSAKVYGEQDASYWARYYKGTVEKDRTEHNVELGGSAVNNLADNMLLFGLAPGSANVFGATYRVFGDIVKAQYPDLVPSYPSVDQILDTSYLRAVAQKLNFDPSQLVASNMNPTKVGGGKAVRVISSRAWNITFKTGSAQFTPQTVSTLDKLIRDLLVAGNTVVEIHGHTDNVGSADQNMKLSEGRAFAVKKWLETKAPAQFPSGRVRVIAHGQTQPVSPNTSSEGRARNRRVEIKLGSTS